jgi:hypothetical protein
MFRVKRTEDVAVEMSIVPTRLSSSLYLLAERSKRHLSSTQILPFSSMTERGFAK